MFTMGTVKCLPVLFVAMLLVSVTKVVSLDDLSNAMQEMMEEMAELKRQVKVLEQNNMVTNYTCIISLN